MKKMIACTCLAAAAATAEVPGEWHSMKMFGDALGEWQFTGPGWSGDEGGVLEPPRGSDDRWLAFNTAEAYQDFEVEFDFRLSSREKAFSLGEALPLRTSTPSTSSKTGLLQARSRAGK